MRRRLLRNTVIRAVSKGLTFALALSSQRRALLIASLFLLSTGNTVAADFDGDSRNDILFRNDDSGKVVIWRMDGATRLSNESVATVANPAWKLAGIADYDGDQSSDLLWRNFETGQVVYWKMAGSSITANLSVDFVPDNAWQIIASPDLNGDGNADLLWRHGLSGQVVYWKMDGATRLQNANIAAVPSLSWQIAATGDFDGDGNDDILWRNQLSGQIALWTMNGASRTGNFNVATVGSVDWQIAGVDRFDGGATSDILWRNEATGQNALWLMSGSAVAANLGVPSVASLDWKIDGVSDFGGDGKADILWRNRSSGQIALWTMNTAVRSANQSVSSSTGLKWLIKRPTTPAPYSGLASRPSNQTCIAPDRPTGNASIAIETAFPSLPDLVKPVALIQPPGDSSHWYVLEQDGRLLRFENSPSASSFSTSLDISAIVDSEREGGLLGMAFHPDYANNDEVFLSYTASDPYESRISRFTTSDDGLTFDLSSQEVLVSLPQPYSNHNGGSIVFGPDGFLYFGFGDGGGAGDSGDRAQSTSNLFGSVLRIDVDGGIPYSIPDTNPNFGNALCDAGSGLDACPEIYAWGFRNPWRFSFDSSTGFLWLGDVGQDMYEEVNIVELGGNYGWRCREGAHDFDTSGICPEGLIDPIIEYDHTVGLAITGGYVYRGSAIPELTGRYVFADYALGQIFASTTDAQGNFGYDTLLETGSRISSFAEDENGELLFLKYSGSSGEVRRIIQSSGSSVQTVPDQLSATGCVESLDPTQPAAGLIPYEINVPFWSDGAVKERYYSVPDGTTIDVDADGDWLFPIGTVLMKNFRLNGELFETRLFMRHTDGDWAGYTYEWNQAGTDATRVIGGKVKDVAGQQWLYPSGPQCMSCHTDAANFSLGLEHAQLNREFRYPGTGLVVNQLDTAASIGMLTDPLSDDAANLPKLYDSVGPDSPPAEDVEEASRAYLHSNCSGCHRPVGPAPSDMDLRFNVSFAATNTCDVAPSSGDLGVSSARLIAPGDSTASIIPNRMNRRDVHGMPPLASAIPDTDGVALISQWIDSLTGCP